MTYEVDNAPLPPFFCVSNANALCDLLIGVNKSPDVQTLKDLCLLSEGLVLCEKVCLPNALFGYFKNWHDRFGVNTNSLFENGSKVCRLVEKIIESQDLGILLDHLSKIIPMPEHFHELTNLNSTFASDLIKSTNKLTLLVTKYTLSAAAANVFEHGAITNNFTEIEHIANLASMDILFEVDYDKCISTNGSVGSVYGYKKVIEAQKLSVERIEKITAKKSLHVPPIFSLVLARSKKADEIPKIITELRAEFADLRKMNTDFREKVSNAGTLKLQIEIAEDYLYSEDLLGKKLKNISKPTSYIRCLLKYTKAIGPTAAMKMIAKDAVEEVENKISLNRVNRYVDIYKEVLNSEDINKNLKRLFSDY